MTEGLTPADLRVVGRKGRKGKGREEKEEREEKEMERRKCRRRREKKRLAMMSMGMNNEAQRCCQRTQESPSDGCRSL